MKNRKAALINKFVRAAAKDSSSVGLIGRRLLASLPGSPGYSLMQQVQLGMLPRPQYAYTAICASETAVRLGYKEVTWIEFGVAGGAGLLVLEQIKSQVEETLPVHVRIVGFDMGAGLPAPVDYRDLPYAWKRGFYEMDIPALKSRLNSAELVIGPVSDTLPSFISKGCADAPVGMISFDLDYYSSTVEAFKIFDLSTESILPRVFCNMDDVIGSGEVFSDYTGARLAIREFNARGEYRKLSPCYDFAQFAHERWQEKVMVYHDFQHSRYSEYVGDDAGGQLPL
ncbi:hypothetical protein [Mycolicibacterium llatzerense]|uniref:hypothetical protein n=1 Tax=Mycolicibacterium llatzerense TaxID=280871 RepID=UPI00103D1500|nr:hypothetical protein [Mycolicibacterium llatzerense]